MSLHTQKKLAKTKIRLVVILTFKVKTVLIDPAEQSKSFVSAVKMNLIFEDKRLENQATGNTVS